MHPDRWLSLFLARPLLRTGLPLAGPGIPILMYHSISADLETGVLPYFRVTITPSRFREHMCWLHTHGYAVIDLVEALRRLEGQVSDLDRCAVLTFDDGFRNFLTDGWPVLAEFGFAATMFLPTAFIGNSRKSFKGRECLTWPEARELQTSGVSFGSHAVNHSMLYELSWTELRRELSDSRLQLEEQLQRPIQAFAYPYAYPQEDKKFRQRLRQELLDQGYRICVTTAIGRARRKSDPLALKRLPLNECDDEPLFRAKLIGAYDWLGGAQAILRRSKRCLQLHRFN